MNNRWLQTLRSIVDGVFDSPSKGVEMEDFISHEKIKIEELQQIIKYLEYIYDDSRRKEEKLMQNLRPILFMHECSNSKDEDRELLQDAITQLFIFNMKIAENCIHALSKHSTKEMANKALKLIYNHDFLTCVKERKLLLIKTCEHKGTCL